MTRETRPNHPPKELLGIDVPVGSNILIATFPLMFKDPAHIEMDLARKTTGAAWVTSPLPGLGQGIESVIGPEGNLSPILLRWSEQGPEFFHYRNGQLQLNPIPVEDYAGVMYAGIPEGGVARTVGKNYPGLREYYTVLQLPGATGTHSIDSFAPYLDTGRLISGMRKRPLPDRLKTGFLAIRLTDKTELPYGRELRNG